MTLGECINNYIIEHDLSMRKFAALAGITHSYVSNIVNGKTSRGNAPVPSIDVYRGIAKAMGIDVNTLIGLVDDEIAWGEEKNPVSKENGIDELDVQLMSYIKNLSIDQKKFLLAQIQTLVANQGETR